MNHIAISGLLIFVTSFLCSLFIFLKGPRNHTSWTLGLFSLSASFWGLGLFRGFITDVELTALAWSRFLNLSALFIPLFFFHFVLCYTDRIKYKKKELHVYYIISLTIFILAIIFPGIFVSSVRPVLSLKFYPSPGFLYYVFTLVFAYLVAYSLILLSKDLKSSIGIRKNQIKYLVLGVFIGFVGGATSFFPVFNIKIYPFGTYLGPIYVITITYAIFRYRLMDINIALTRAGIFAIVYTFVLGLPLIIGYKYGLWQYATWLMLVLATLGPLIYTRLRKQAEARLLAEERHARDLLTQASEGMMRIRSIKRLMSLMVHVTCKTLKLENAMVFLFDEDSGEYKLEAVRLKSKYRYLQSLGKDDPLIQKLSSLEEPLVYEEVKSLAQQLKNKPDDPIHEIESQMSRFSGAVIIPASSRGYLLGFLVLSEKKSNRMYSTEDLNVLWVLSNQAALAIENAQFHKKAQEALLKEDREMTARFIGHGASHQFGNVLNRIIQRSSGRQMDLDELDLNSISSEELKKLVLELKGDFQAITNAGMQGKEIVSGILSMGAGSPVDFKQEDLKTIIQRSVQTIKLKELKAHIQHMDSPPEIVTDIPDALPKIWCNSLQIEQVLDNMLDNGLEAIEEKEFALRNGELKNDESFRGRVLVKAAVAEERIFLEILDNGIGIKQTDSKNMFTPFFTTKATERLSRKGHGIGMHVVKEIIKAHQGKIYVADTEYGIGTTFMIEFPLKITENKKIQK